MMFFSPTATSRNQVPELPADGLADDDDGSAESVVVWVLARLNLDDQVFQNVSNSTRRSGSLLRMALHFSFVALSCSGD